MHMRTMPPSLRTELGFADIDAYRALFRKRGLPTSFFTRFTMTLSVLVVIESYTCILVFRSAWGYFDDLQVCDKYFAERVPSFYGATLP